MQMRSAVLVLMFMVSVPLASSRASACPVCFGNSESQLTQSAAAGVLFMVVLTYSLLVVGFGGVLTFFMIRARRLRHAPAAPAEHATPSVVVSNE